MKCVCACAQVSLLERQLSEELKVSREGEGGAAVFSGLSEPLAGGSRRERRPPSLLFVASWRAAFKPAALPLLLHRKVMNTKRLGGGGGGSGKGAFDICVQGPRCTAEADGSAAGNGEVAVLFLSARAKWT